MMQETINPYEGWSTNKVRQEAKRRSLVGYTIQTHEELIASLRESDKRIAVLDKLSQGPVFRLTTAQPDAVAVIRSLAIACSLKLETERFLPYSFVFQPTRNFVDTVLSSLPQTPFTLVYAGKTYFREELEAFFQTVIPADNIVASVPKVTQQGLIDLRNQLVSALNAAEANTKAAEQVYDRAKQAERLARAALLTIDNPSFQELYKNLEAA